MLSLVHRLRWSCHYYGVVMTALSVTGRIAARCGWNIASHPSFLAFKDRAIDRRFRISTAGQVPTHEFDVDAAQQKHAIQYQPTSSLDLAVLLDGLAREVDLREFSFVDFGSGKGRVILLASEFPFRSVAGVEFSHALHQAACENISTFRSTHQRCRDVRSVCQNAVDFELPAGPVVAFFFNPFDAVIMSQVLGNIEQSINDDLREVVCIYHNPVHRELLDRSAAWQELTGWPIEHGQWAVYRAGDQPAQSQLPVSSAHCPPASSSASHSSASATCS